MENVKELCPTSPNSGTELSVLVGKDPSTEELQYVTFNSDFPLALMEGNLSYSEEVQTVMQAFTLAYYNLDRVEVIPTKVGNEGLQFIWDLVQERANDLSKVGRREMEEYNLFKLESDPTMKRVLSFVEITGYQYNEETEDLLERIGRFSRVVGVHLVVSLEGTLRASSRHLFNTKMHVVDSELILVNQGGFAFECVGVEIN